MDFTPVLQKEIGATAIEYPIKGILHNFIKIIVLYYPQNLTQPNLFRINESFP